MPRYDTTLLNYASTWFNELQYGYAQDGVTQAGRDVLQKLWRWSGADTRDAVTDAPSELLQSKLKFLDELRRILDGTSGRSTISLFVRFDGDTSSRPTAHWFTVPDPRDGQTGNVEIGLVKDATSRVQYTAQWCGTLSRPNRWMSEAESAAITRSLTHGSTMPEGIVFEPAANGAGYAGTIVPTPELLATLPEKARLFANRTVPAQDQPIMGRIWELADDGTVTNRFVPVEGRVVTSITITGAELVEFARLGYRAWLRQRWAKNTADEREVARLDAIRQHKIKSAANFRTFRSKQAIEDRLIPTLPFLPHGLASSRRWGIEIESAGCRGVQAPGNGWRRKGDSSLRSAWAGYREVQDFEAYDEEVSETLSWYQCENMDRHMPHEEYFDESRNEYAFRVREDYLPVENCENCGARTRTVRREPQTIVHSAQNDDCGEFVSPILTSMHSNGLQTLLAGLEGQPQNNTAGVHVHVEATDLNDRQIATLIYGYDLIEHMLESSYQRGDVRNYCKRRPEDNVLEMARSLKRKEVNTINGARGGDRYVTVNTCALSAHGTIEFRAMGPVYDYEYLIRWAMFCREMVNIAYAGVTQKEFGRVKKWEDVLVLFAKYGKEYVRAAVFEMTGETGSQARLAKESRPISTAAANEDLSSVIDQIRSGAAGTPDAFRRLARTVAPALTPDATATSISRRLAVSDSNLVTV